MSNNPQIISRRAAPVYVLAVASALLGGCAVVTVAGTAVSIAASGVGLAADAAVGAVRLTGKAVGAAADAVIASGGAEPR
jgi:hypothetical protein